MRIVIDMQGAQTESRFRGIGRYSLSLAQAIARNRGEHEVILALSGLFPQTIEPIRKAFAGILPQQNIRVWHGVGPTRECDPANAARRRLAEQTREAAIFCMQPDVVLLTSLFEGLGDDAVTSIGLFDNKTPVATILYDLIPLISPDEHFRSSEIHMAYYQGKIESIKRSNVLLAISESSRNEALDSLNFSQERVVNISAGCDPRFKPAPLSPEDKDILFKKFGIERPFVMYTGGADERKNLHRLIEAFALLPGKTRAVHQLVMVGKMPDTRIADYRGCAEKFGLSKDELVFTGFVSDAELMQLYTACRLFVFPSLHEGFGLPPLEAMACGVPVIASCLTSLPEVIGREDVLFDPYSAEAMKAKMALVLADDGFRADLVRYGYERIKVFSWDQSARRAIDALVRAARHQSLGRFSCVLRETRTGIFAPKHLRILVSKLDHMGDLVLAIPALTKLRARYPEAHIDAVVGSWNVAAAEQLAIFRKVYALDFFAKKSSVEPKRQMSFESFLNSLPEYDLAVDLRRQADTRFILGQINAKLRAGYSTGDSAIDELLGVCLPAEPDVPFQATRLNRTSISLQMLQLVDALPGGVNDFLNMRLQHEACKNKRGCVAIFPFAGNDVKEWGATNFLKLVFSLGESEEVERIGVFVRTAEEGAVFEGQGLKKVVVYAGLEYSDLKVQLAQHGVCVSNNSFGAHLASWMGLRVVGVYGGQETVAEWGPVFGDVRILHVPVPCSPCHIPDKSACMNDLRCLTAIRPDAVMAAVKASLVDQDALFVATPETMKTALIQKIASDAASLNANELKTLAESIALNTPLREHKRLFVDVSELVRRDSRTGIQRVVRSILACLIKSENVTYEVQPVYAVADQPGYRVARNFLARMKGVFGDESFDELLDYQAGDVFLGLDLQPEIVPAQREYLKTLRNNGVSVFFVVYDILCLRMPQYCNEATVQAFQNWIQTIVEGDGALCISQAVRDDLLHWLDENGMQDGRRFFASWFHLGADIQNSNPSLGLPAEAEPILGVMQARPTFLMVGTLEPRKGHAFALEAFDRLWREGNDVCLMIVGKEGWNVDALSNRIKSHPEYGSRLLWLEGVSDEFLERLYAQATCLVAASEGEGFGLPLIEAAKHGLPIIARDIPVFKEVAGNRAYYFPGRDPDDLMAAVMDWLTLNQAGRVPASANLPWLTWQQSTDALLRLIGDHSVA